METTRWTRRGFLDRLSRLALVLSAPLALRCGDGAGSGAGREEIEAQARTYDGDLTCTETKGLWPAELKTRTDNEYRDRSAKPGEYCFSCANFQKPKVQGTCGTCTTVKGPVQPLGWCKTWTKLRS